MNLYGIKTCDTCRKALKSLQATGKPVTFVDIRETPLTLHRLQAFHEKFNEALVNTRSTTWRNLSESERAEDPIALLSAHPTLMKRPVIEADQLYLGWGKDVQAALL